MREAADLGPHDRALTELFRVVRVLADRPESPARFLVLGRGKTTITAEMNSVVMN